MNSSSRGRSGRRTITAGAAGGAAAAAGAAPAGADVAAAPPPPAAALTAFSQAGETFALFFSRHSSAGAPPGGTLAHTLGQSARHALLTAATCALLGCLVAGAAAAALGAAAGFAAGAGFALGAGGGGPALPARP